MKIASVTITSNRENIITDAILSVRDWVDAAVVVDLGITDSTLDIITRLMDEVGKPVHVTKMDPNGSTCGQMRNAGMKLAQELGFDWCCTLDTDERIHIGAGVDIRKALECIKDQADLIIARDTMGRYYKERFFKLPTEHWFIGNAHEKTQHIGKTANFPNVTFYELPKTEEETRAKCEFIVAEKLRELEENPSVAWDWYYLGDAYAFLGHHDKAIAAFDKCCDLTQVPDEGAWASFRAAMCFRKMDDTKSALNRCARGLTFHPGYAELAWLASALEVEAGNYKHGIYWARMSMINGQPEIDIQHYSHCLPSGVWEGPYVVLRDAYRMLGQQEEADKWDAKAVEIRGMKVAA